MHHISDLGLARADCVTNLPRVDCHLTLRKSLNAGCILEWVARWPETSVAGGSRNSYSSELKTAVQKTNSSLLAAAGAEMFEVMVKAEFVYRCKY